MYSANDWRCYALLHADKVSKWEWPGGNNSKAYNEWYYSHHKDKWRQYYLNKKKKQGGEDVARNMKLLMKIGRDARSGNWVRYTKAAAATERVNALDRHNPEMFKKTRPVVEAAVNMQSNARRVRDGITDTFSPKGYPFPSYQDAAEYPDQQTPSRGASRRRQTR